jgi:hypothetical protein
LSERNYSNQLDKARDSWVALSIILQMMEDPKANPKEVAAAFSDSVGSFKGNDAALPLKDFYKLDDLVQKWADDNDANAKKDFKDLILKLRKDNVGKIVDSILA